MDGLTSVTNVDSLLLQSPVAADGQVGNTERGSAVAEQFEAVFFSLLLKNMRATMTENGLFGKEGSDTFGGMFDLFMGQHLASANPLGIGKMMNSYLAIDDYRQHQQAEVRNESE